MTESRPATQERSDKPPQKIPRALTLMWRHVEMHVEVKKRHSLQEDLRRHLEIEDLCSFLVGFSLPQMVERVSVPRVGAEEPHVVRDLRGEH